MKRRKEDTTNYRLLVMISNNDNHELSNGHILHISCNGQPPLNALVHHLSASSTRLSTA